VIFDVISFSLAAFALFRDLSHKNAWINHTNHNVQSCLHRNMYWNWSRWNVSYKTLVQVNWQQILSRKMHKRSRAFTTTAAGGSKIDRRFVDKYFHKSMVLTQQVKQLMLRRASSLFGRIYSEQCKVNGNITYCHWNTADCNWTRYSVFGSSQAQLPDTLFASTVVEQLGKGMIHVTAKV